MKIKYSNFICFTILIFVFVFVFGANKANAYIPSQAEMVMEAKSGRVLSELNSDEKLPMASTTKVVTALTVIENYDLDKVITVTDKTVGVEGSSVYLRSGNKFTVKDLLYGLMLRSGNDCAETLAVGLAGSIENFVSKMNETATKYGAKSSNFTNPHGLPDNEHYTTAHDLCAISCAAIENVVLREIVSSKSYTATELSEGRKILWLNKNKLLSSYDGANGIKTGYTVKAGRCLVSSALRDEMQVVCVVLNSPQMFERSKELLDAAFSNYRFVKLVDGKKFDYEIISEGNTAYKLSLGEDFYYPIGKNESIEVETDLPENFSLELKSGCEAGDIKIYSSKRLIFSRKIYTL